MLPPTAHGSHPFARAQATRNKKKSATGAALDICKLTAMTTQTLQSELLFRALSSCKSEEGTNKTNKTLTSCKRGKSSAFEYCLKRNRQLQHTLCWVRPLNTKRASSFAQQSYNKFGVEEPLLPVPCVVSLCFFFATASAHPTGIDRLSTCLVSRSAFKCTFRLPAQNQQRQLVTGSEVMVWLPASFQP